MTEELEHQSSHHQHQHQPTSNYRRSRTLASSEQWAIITDRADKGNILCIIFWNSTRCHARCDHWGRL